MTKIRDILNEDAVTSAVRTQQYAKDLSNTANKRLTATTKAIERLLGNSPDNLTPSRQRTLQKSIRKHLIKLRKDLVVIVRSGSIDIGTIMATREFNSYSKVLEDKPKKATVSSILRGVRNANLAGLGNINQAVGGYVDGINRRIVRSIRFNASESLGSSSLKRSFSGRVSSSIVSAARRDLTAVAKTASTAASSAGRIAFAEANQDIISSMKIIATLDNRTSVVCGSLDGKIVPVGSRRPPFHVNCRSTIIFELKRGTRLSGGLRSSGSGKVSSNLTYKGWLNKKISSDPKSIIKTFGRTKGKLLIKNGAGEINRFVDKDLVPLDIKSIIR